MPAEAPAATARPAVVTSDPMLPRLHRLVRVRGEAKGVKTLALQPLEGAATAGTPGQFNMLWAFGVGESAISLSGEAPGGILLHTVRDVGPVTDALCHARPGTVMGVRGPFGRGWRLDHADGSDIVVVAGGLGLAPLRPLLRHLVAHRHRYGRVALLVGARSPDQLLFGPESRRWARSDLTVLTTVDHARPGWDGPVGVVTDLIERAPFDPSRTVAYVCGPEVMMRFTARALAERGVAPASIQVSMERNMRCAVGFCGHCQLGPAFVCRDGPVFSYDFIRPLLSVREL
jgi:NAD(P)H-flavin reductase